MLRSAFRDIRHTSVHAISPGPKPEALGVASALTLPASAESYLPNGWQRVPQANSKGTQGSGGQCTRQVSRYCPAPRPAGMSCCAEVATRRNAGANPGLSRNCDRGVTCHVTVVPPEARDSGCRMFLTFGRGNPGRTG